MPYTVEVENPNILAIPTFREFLSRAIAKSPWKGVEIMEEVRNLIQSKSVGVHLTQEDGKLVAISFTMLPTSKFDTTPQVAYLYNEGSSAARKSLISQIVDFISQAGYNRFWVLNYTQAKDTAWAKVMQPEGWDISPIGSIMEFKHG
jgi:hypothetical protein